MLGVVGWISVRWGNVQTPAILNYYEEKIEKGMRHKQDMFDVKCNFSKNIRAERR